MSGIDDPTGRRHVSQAPAGTNSDSLNLKIRQSLAIPASRCIARTCPRAGGMRVYDHNAPGMRSAAANPHPNRFGALKDYARRARSFGGAKQFCTARFLSTETPRKLGLEHDGNRVERD